MRVYDGGFPTLSDTTFVDVNVIRVTDVLSFFTSNYFETITENLPVAASVLTVSAQPSVGGNLDDVSWQPCYIESLKIIETTNTCLCRKMKLY